MRFSNFPRTQKLFGLLFVLIMNTSTSTVADCTIFEAFMATECGEVYSGDQLCQYGISLQNSGHCLFLHHQGTDD